MATFSLAIADPDYRSHIQELLQFCGHSVGVELSPDGLSQTLRETIPDGLIVDAHQSDTIALCQRLRGHSLGFGIPILAIVSTPSAELVEKLIQNGVDEILVAPVFEEGLSTALLVLKARRNLRIKKEVRAGHVFADRYRITKTLGKGGASTVYLADDLLEKSKVALKLMSAVDQSRIFVSQFLREAYALSLLSHENIVKMIEFGNQDNTYYIATEFIQGQSLHSLIANSPISQQYALFIAAEVSCALQYLDEYGIIHRDIKPHNLMISPENNVVLVDFGLAKQADQRTLLLKRDEMQGTPEYLAPEYISNCERQTIAVDIYALGITLFYAVSGQLPFSGLPEKVVQDHLHTKPPRLEELVPFVSKRFANMVDHMLVKDPEKRCTISELQQAIESCGGTRKGKRRN